MSLIAKIGSVELCCALTVGKKLTGKKKGYDLGDLDSGILQKMLMDPEVLGEVVWAIFEIDLADKGIKSKEQFTDLLNGDAVRSLDAAMREAIKDFFSWGSMVLDKIDQTVKDALKNSPTSGDASGDTQES